MRTAEQIADEMASEWRRRFGHKMSEIERIWLARCIMEARHELAVDMAKADGPCHFNEHVT